MNGRDAAAKSATTDNKWLFLIIRAGLREFVASNSNAIKQFPDNQIAHYRSHSEPHRPHPVSSFDFVHAICSCFRIRFMDICFVFFDGWWFLFLFGTSAELAYAFNIYAWFICNSMLKQCALISNGGLNSGNNAQYSFSISFSFSCLHLNSAHWFQPEYNVD